MEKISTDIVKAIRIRNVEGILNFPAISKQEQATSTKTRKQIIANKDNKTDSNISFLDSNLHRKDKCNEQTVLRLLSRHVSTSTFRRQKRPHRQDNMLRN